MFRVTSFLQIARSRALVVLMLGHFANDMQAGVLPMLFPLMKPRLGLSNAELGPVTLAFTAASSLTQPVFGCFSDTHGRRWFVPATLVWGAVCAACYGFVGSYAVFLALAALGGIGSGAFHPLGASTAAVSSAAAALHALTLPVEHERAQEALMAVPELLVPSGARR